MEPSSLFKVAGAFAAGVILALGGALVYLKTNVAPAHAVAPWVIPGPETQSPKNPPAVIAVPAPSVQNVGALPIVVQRVQRVRPKAAVAPATPTIMQVAQTAPPAPTQVSVVPVRPAVNEGQGPTGPQLGVPAPSYPPPAPAPHVVTLQSGTNLVVRLIETVSTDHNYAGDTFHAALDVPLILDGFIIADKGSKVLGKISSAQKSGMQLTITEINTTDGQHVPVETSFCEKQAPGRGGEDAAKIGGGAALGAIIGAIAGGGKGAAIGAGVGGGAGTGAVLLSHGKAASLPAETQLTFQLTRPATITEKLN